MERSEGVHLEHCNRGEYVGSCKYGYALCPAIMSHKHKWKAEYDNILYGESFQCGCSAIAETQQIEDRLNAWEELTPMMQEKLLEIVERRSDED